MLDLNMNTNRYVVFINDTCATAGWQECPFEFVYVSKPWLKVRNSDQDDNGIDVAYLLERGGQHGVVMVLEVHISSSKGSKQKEEA